MTSFKLDIDIILQTLIQDYRLVRNVLQMDVCVTITGFHVSPHLRQKQLYIFFFHLYLIRRKNILISKRDPEEEAAQTSSLLACFTVCETVE